MKLLLIAKLEVNSIKVNNAKNDCVDFSFGNYDISKAVLTKCGDKGFSVGEKSTANLKNI